MWQKIKDWLSRYASFALPARLVVGSLIGLIAGPGLLGFATELATYRYAHAQGIRPPLEGIPYLRVAVTLGSFSLLAVGAALFYLSLYIAGRIASGALKHIAQLRKMVPETTDTMLQRFRSLSLKRAFQLSLIVALLFGCFSFAVRYFAENKRELDPAVFVFAAYGSLATLLVWRKQVAWWLAASVTITAFAVAIVTMFNIDRYAEFLRFVGYGGGIPVTVRLTEEASTTDNNIEAFLVLRTTKAVILYDPTTDGIRETPLQYVYSIQHKAQPLTSLQSKLPAP